MCAWLCAPCLRLGASIVVGGCGGVLATPSGCSADADTRHSCAFDVGLWCSRCCRYVACVGMDTLTVMGTNFETKLLEFNTASDPPSQVVWCGEVSSLCHHTRFRAQAHLLLAAVVARLVQCGGVGFRTRW